MIYYGNYRMYCMLISNSYRKDLHTIYTIQYFLYTSIYLFEKFDNTRICNLKIACLRN